MLCGYTVYSVRYTIYRGGKMGESKKISFDDSLRLIRKSYYWDTEYNSYEKYLEAICQDYVRYLKDKDYFPESQAGIEFVMNVRNKKEKDRVYII